MGENEVALILRGAFLLIVKVGAIPMLTVLATGLLVSIIQAVTQINEQTLAFVPKVMALLLVLTMTGHYLFTTLADFTTADFDRIVAAGG
jgi:flagellar biosynthesis protein FliQ